MHISFNLFRSCHINRWRSIHVWNKSSLIKAFFGIKYHPSLSGQREILEHFVEKEEIVTYAFFDHNKSELNTEAIKSLNVIIENFKLNRVPVKKYIYVYGHASLVGKDDQNFSLSKKRATVVYDFFLKKGVPKNNLIMKYHGSKKTLGLSKDAFDRRVRIFITPID